MRAPPPKTVGKRVATSSLCARLNPQVTLHAQPDGSIAASVNGYANELGKFSAETATRAADLRTGMKLSTIASTGAKVREINQLVRRLAHRGLLEYPLLRDDRELAVIEPQAADYWPQPAKLNDTDAIVLSRLAYLRRRGSDMVLESPRANALFRISDSRIASLLAILSTPHTMTRLRRLQGFPGTELLALLLSCNILFKVSKSGDDGRRANEGDEHLVMWDFHDLLFHARSNEGRQANPVGALYAHAGAIAPQPAVRPRWPGQRIDLVEPEAMSPPVSSFTSLLHTRRSIRSFDDGNPITLVELSRLLDAAARIRSTWTSDLDFGETGPVMTYAARPYPGAGSAYELELYLAVANCAGLARGFYHYDAQAHALVSIAVKEPQLEAMLMAAAYAMDAPSQPQILMTATARFGRVSWKYSSVAYSLILKNAGVLLQTLYLTATDMGLGGCAIGTNNIALFAKMTGLEFHVEGPVAQFALGRAPNQDFEAHPGASHSDSDD